MSEPRPSYWRARCCGFGGIGLFLLILAGCGALGRPPGVQAPLQSGPAPVTSHVAPIPTAVPPPTVDAPIAMMATAAAWQIYQSDRGGFRLNYPIGWTVTEQVADDGTSITTFSSGAGYGVIVIASSISSGQTAPSDLPNMHCQAVTVDGLPGTRCTDSIASTTSTTLVSQGKYYGISTNRKGAQQIYQRLIDSFTVVR